MELVAAANDDDFFGGGEVGMRLQLPTPLAPLMGTGLFTGASSGGEPALYDNLDNHDEGWTDEQAERGGTFDRALSTVFPETGLRLWWTRRIRLTGFGCHLITTDGRANDAWYGGFTIALFSKK